MDISVSLVVNGAAVQRRVDPDLTLLRFLREELGLKGTKNGCEKGQCGSCTVIVDGQAKRSCLIKMGKAQGLRVETIESLSPPGAPLGVIQQAFVDEGAVQCGFCTPGMVMSAKALLDKTPAPTPAQIREALKYNICRCTGYAAIERAVARAARLAREAAGGTAGGEGVPPATRLRDHSVVGPGAVLGMGTPAPRKDAPAKARGEPVFADDLGADRPLTGKLLFSAHAHARLVALDTAAAAAAPGVALVLTAADVPGRNAFGLFVPQQPVLVPVGAEVKYLGDVVAAVFAETREQAEYARNLIRATYEPLPALLSAEANLAPGAPLVHADTEDNVVHHVAVRKGDAAAAFAADDAVVVEGDYATPAIEHAYLEPESCLVEPDGQGGLVVKTGNQGSLEYREMIAKSLAIPEEKVRVVLTACGGGFGGKEEPAGQIHAALAALRTGRSVKLVLTREESIRTSTKRHPMRLRMRHAATRDGKLLAIESRVVADAGAYISQTKPVIFRSAVTASGPYVVPHFSADSWGVYTHNNPSGAFRGFGSTQASFASEIQIDKLAWALGLDAAEFRRRNAYGPGSVTGTGQTLREGIGFRGTLEAAAAALDALRAEFGARDRPAHVKVGFALAGAYKNVGIGTGLSDHAGAIVELKADGRLEVRTGAAEIGQGSNTVAAQLAGEVLAVPYELIDVVACDTAVCPDGGMTTGSRQTFVTGNAVKAAAERFKARLGTLWPTAIPDGAALAAVYQAARAAGIDCRLEYTYLPPKTYAHRTEADPDPARAPEEFDIHYAYCFASAAVALEVDTRTGEIRVLKVFASQDVGRVINPVGVRGQIEGAVAMGLGYALSEEFLEDEGRIITDDLRRLGVPRIADVPPIEVHIVEEPHAQGPFGAKGIGEVGLNPVAPAVANAVFDAAGVRIDSLPLKKEKVLAALAALVGR